MEPTTLPEFIGVLQREMESTKRLTEQLQAKLALQEQSLSRAPSDLKVTLSASFDGDRAKSTHFMDDLNFYFSLHHDAPDNKKLYIAQSCMRGDAKEWFHNEVKAKAWTSWAEFERDFLSFFTDPISQHRADEELRRLRQSSHGDCSRHIQKFQSIVERSSLDRRNVQMLVSFFVNSLNDRWRKELQRQALLVPTLFDNFSLVTKTLLQIEGIDKSFIPDAAVDPMELDLVAINQMRSHRGSQAKTTDNAKISYGHQMTAEVFAEFKTFCASNGLCQFCLRLSLLDLLSESAMVYLVVRISNDNSTNKLRRVRSQIYRIKTPL